MRCECCQSMSDSSANSNNSQRPSYGDGVRAQVFEVIVRQGMKGAPWREICVGPMQVNNITVEEVEAEIRRRGGNPGTGSSPSSPPPPPSPISPPRKPVRPGDFGGASLKPATPIDQLFSVIDLVKSMLREKKSSGDGSREDLEKIRGELDFLSNLMIAEEMDKKRVNAEAQLQQDLERENHRTRKEIKPPGLD